MKARLAIYRDGRLASSYPLPEPGTTIGRDKENHVCLEDPMVSRRHCVVHAKDGMWVIKDLSSTNGIKVNGVPVTHAMLKNGDSVVIGPFALVFEMTSDENAANAEFTESSTVRFKPSDLRRLAPETITLSHPPEKPEDSPGGGSGAA